jgi:hypothetical protein
MNTTPDLPRLEISHEEWAWVHDLIQDVQAQAERDSPVKTCGEWEMALREFRKIEMKRMVLGSPTEKDRLSHGACLHALLATGKVLILEILKFPDGELASHGVTLEQIAAQVEELEQTVRESNHPFSDAELDRVRGKLFSGPA